MIQTDENTISLRASRVLKSLLAFTLLLAPGGLSSRPVLAAPVPEAGSLLQEMPVPKAQAVPAAPSLSLPAPESAGLPATAPFQVDHIRITGNTLFPADELHALVASGEGKEMTLKQVGDLARNITLFYQQQGYPLDRAYIPAQTISDGTLTIAVSEARYDKVSLSNDTHADPSLLEATLAPARHNAPVNSNQLNRSLLLLNEIPGVTTSSTLSPGQASGTSDLTVKAQPLPRFSGDLGIDDYGDRYTGRARLSGNYTINNPLNWGDQVTFRGLTTGQDLNYGRIGYQSVINGQGTVAGVSGSFLDYRLNGRLKALDAHGNAGSGTLLVRQPIIRNLTSSLDAQVAYSYKRLSDDVDDSDTHNDRHINSLDFSLIGSHKDGGGVTSANLTFTGGQVGFDDRDARRMDALGSDTVGGYGKISAAVSRVQDLTDVDSLYLGVSGQLSSKNLDRAEQFYLGGPGSVSGYDPAVVGGDEGVQGTAELRHNFSCFIPGVWQATAFINYGYVEINKDNGFARGAGDNHAALSSAGLGLNWTEPHGWIASVSVGVPFGSTPEIISGESHSTRLWLSIRKTF